MNKLVFIDNGRVVTDSLTIAEVFGKEHKNVLRDIEIQIQKLNEAGEGEWGRLNFEHTRYQNQQNKQWYPKYNLTEDAFTIVAMSYVTPESMKMKVKFIREFKRMREQLALYQTPSYMIDDPIKRAERWIAEYKERLALEEKITEYKTKASYVDQILQSKDTVTITQIAKDYGLSGKKLNEILHEEKVQYKLNDQWLLYSKYQDKGFTKSQTIDLVHKSGERKVKLNTRWTQKGRLFIHELLKKRGIIPCIDRDHVASINE